MGRQRTAAVLVAVALAAAACGDGGERDGTGGAAAPAGGDAGDGGNGGNGSGGANDACDGVTLEATEVGISADTIVVEIVADTGSSAIPGMANGAVEAVEEWAAMVNEQGGLACRQVEVRTYDSKINPDESRNGFVEACENAFAAVGTIALSVADVTPLQDCADKAGETTGLPEVPGLTISPLHTCNATTITIFGSGQPCPPVTGEREMEVAAAAGDFLADRVGDDAHGLYLIPTTSPVTLEAVMGPIEYLQDRGLAADVEAGAKGSDPQSVYTPYATALRDDESTFVYGATTWPSYLLLQKEAETQGVDLDTWFCLGACYDPAYAEAGGSTVTGTLVGVNYLPDEEADVNDEVREFTSRVEEVNTFARGAWVAGRQFQQAVEDVVADAGPNGLTRASLLDALNALEDFDANGMIGPTTPSAKRPAECLVVVEVQDDGSFERVYPDERGTFACTGYDTVTTDPATAFEG